MTITLGGGADDGRPGEGDNLINVECVSLNIGGTFVGTDGPDEFKLSQVGSASTLTGLGGDDRLRGGDGPDRLEGGAGNDSLDGGFGDDVIVGGPGRDTISADLAGGDCGPLWCKLPYGNDTIDARDGEIDSVTCGAGQDTVTADAADVVAPDCETVSRGSAPSGGGAPTGGKSAAKLALVGRPRLAAVLRRASPSASTNAPVGRLTLSARSGKTVVARGSTKVRAGGRATVRLRFTAKARAKLRRARRTTLIITGQSTKLQVTIRR